MYKDTPIFLFIQHFLICIKNLFHLPIIIQKVDFPLHVANPEKLADIIRLDLSRISGTRGRSTTTRTCLPQRRVSAN